MDFKNIPGNPRMGINIPVFVTMETQIFPRKELLPGKDIYPRRLTSYSHLIVAGNFYSQGTESIFCGKTLGYPHSTHIISSICTYNCSLRLSFFQNILQLKYINYF
jgi:hypothetical protein